MQHDFIQKFCGMDHDGEERSDYQARQRAKMEETRKHHLENMEFETKNKHQRNLNSRSDEKIVKARNSNGCAMSLVFD